MTGLVAHLGYLEILTPDLPASTAFFHDIVGMDLTDETADADQSLRPGAAHGFGQAPPAQ